MGVERIEFALERGAHGAAGAVEHRVHVQGFARGLLALDEFAHAGLEDAGQGAALVALAAGALVQGVQVAAGPEAALELLGLRARGADREHLAEDISPAHDRQQQEQGHDQLHQHVGIGDQGYKREVVGCGHGLTYMIFQAARILAATSSGRERGRVVRTSTQPIFTLAELSSTSPHHASWRN